LTAGVELLIHASRKLFADNNEVDQFLQVNDSMLLWALLFAFLCVFLQKGRFVLV